MFFSNISILNTNEIEESENFLTKIQKFNTLFTICIIIIGLIGNFITVIIYGQKKYRKNSSNVFILCLAINDTLFLVVHFFQDTIRNIKSNFDLEQTIIEFINKIDIIVHHDLACKLIIYLRYSFRMISAYLIIALTIQRLFLVYKPLNEKNKRKSSAWKSVIIVILISFFANFWTFLFFELNENDANFYCDIVNDLKSIYFSINILYSMFVMILPIIILIVLNILIIYKLNKADKKREIITSSKPTTSNNPLNNRVDRPLSDVIIRLEPLLVNNQNSLECLKKSKPTDTKTVLIIVSISYALLNLPYFITW
jgi:hypothetical protein